MFPAFYMMSLGQMRVGLLGMRRRIADYDPALNFDFTHLIITIAGFVIFASVLVCIYNLIKSIKTGEIADSNPWKSRSPEWLLPTPIPEHNYANHPFEVVGEPYDYGLEGSSYVKMINPPESSTFEI